ncbi:lipase maturation factor 2-like [Adelges cooleyi]|uniref:lipase maturation factor 2-like n=1 Tax=Adelges cooleyi TaxID=133065 RepID=UPI00217F9EE3|nr:lipase maturation factor 2-like [Adelges cooleyi]
MLYIRYTRNLFLRGVAVIYLQAFISLYVQKAGLYGDNGILPVQNVLRNESPKIWDKFFAKPTLLWFSSEIGLTVEYMFDVIALVGVLFAFLGFVSQKVCNKFVFFILWISYLSLYNVGQVFMNHLADHLLLEVGSLCILVAPFFHLRPKPPSKKRNLRLHTSLVSSPHDGIPFWLVRWLLFRVSFSAGIVKMISKNPAWYDLTAMSKYFETLPLPNTISWYVHYFPAWFLKSVTVLAEVNEIFVPLLFLVPIRSVKKLAYYIQIFMQFGILASGNFSYYNLLNVVLCLSLLDDHTFYKELALTKSRQWCSAIFTRLMTLNAAVLLVAIVATLYNFKISPSNTPDFSVGFTPKQFITLMEKAIPFVFIYAAISFFFQCAQSLYVCMPSKLGEPIGNLLKSTTYFGICLFFFFLSSYKLSCLHPSANINSTLTKDMKIVFNDIAPFQLSSSYVPPKELINFNSRNEIILEGANDIKGPWYEYEFLYKPGNVNATPPIVAPYKAMLDEQLFFAAYSTPAENPWFLSLVFRLLNNQKEVISLLDVPARFIKSPPKFIKASLYNYKFSTNVQRLRGIWWTRKFISEYLAPTDKTSQVLLDQLKSYKLLLNRTPKDINPIFKHILDQIRTTQQTVIDPRLLIFGFLMAGFVCIAFPGSFKKE